MNVLERVRLRALKADFSKAETYIKTVIVAVSTGATADVDVLLNQGHEIVFSPAGILLLKHSFIGGAVVGMIGLFTKSPLAKQQ